MHGLIGASGTEWKEQRRFALRHLKDFGFGRSSMEEIILEEFNELAEMLKTKAANEEEVQVHTTV